MLFHFFSFEQNCLIFTNCDEFRGLQLNAILDTGK